MGANTTSREDQKDNTAAAECKSSLIMHANNYCEFTREMEEINATMMAKIEIVSLIYRENENTHTCSSNKQIKYTQGVRIIFK